MNNFISGSIGALIAVMIVLNGTLSKTTGNYTSSIIIHFTGLLCVILILIINRSKINFNRNLPIYLYSAGAIGVFTILFNNLSFSALGVSITLALGLLGQSLCSIIIDHFGLLGMKINKFDKKKYIGLGIIIIGIYVMTIL
jgi:bacterial/archaeal transporter family-2 protein